MYGVNESKVKSGLKYNNRVMQERLSVKRKRREGVLLLGGCVVVGLVLGHFGYILAGFAKLFGLI